MLRAKIEITAALQWGVSDSDGWFDLVDTHGREWGAIHVRQYLRDGRPHIDYTARVTPPFGKTESAEGIEDLPSAMVWVYEKLGVAYIGVDLAPGDVSTVETPLGSPSLVDPRPPDFHD